MTLQNSDFDIAIIGGGMVGASLACALGNQNLRIAIIEAHNARHDTPASYDDRAIALSYGTAQIFRTLGCWQELEPHVTPIKLIHVSDKGHAGITRLSHQEENVDALGYVITARTLGQTLYQLMANYNNVKLISPARLQEIDFSDDYANAKYTLEENDELLSLNARLIIAADGGNSSVRNLMDISAKQYDYRQTAVTANVSTTRAHNNVAYERFTSQGPLAILPMEDNRCSLVWTWPSKSLQQVLDMSDEEFLKNLQKAFGKRLGDFTQVGKRQSYPLRLVKATTQVKRRLALIGNAAHTLHPIAGQGFNLGMRDVAALAQIIVDEHNAGRDFGLLRALQPYQQWRQQDQRRIIGFTDNLVKIFSNRFPPLALARNIGLVATDITPTLKHLLAKHTMGMAGKLPKLVRGLQL